LGDTRLCLIRHHRCVAYMADVHRLSSLWGIAMPDLTRPPYFSGNYNIAKQDGTILLENWVDWRNAVYWLEYYNRKYAPGTPFPNHQGVYTDQGFHIVEKDNA